MLPEEYDVVLDTEVETALFVGPLRSGDPTAARSVEREIERLVEEGRRAEVIVPEGTTGWRLEFRLDAGRARRAGSLELDEVRVVATPRALVRGS